MFIFLWTSPFKLLSLVTDILLRYMQHWIKNNYKLLNPSSWMREHCAMQQNCVFYCILTVYCKSRKHLNCLTMSAFDWHFLTAVHSHKDFVRPHVCGIQSRGWSSTDWRNELEWIQSHDESLKSALLLKESKPHFTFMHYAFQRNLQNI